MLTIYYCTKNQVHGLCVAGDMVILFVGSFHGKMIISPPTHTHLMLGIVIDIVSIFYHTKNQVGVLCWRSLPQPTFSYRLVSRLFSTNICPSFSTCQPRWPDHVAICQVHSSVRTMRAVSNKLTHPLTFYI